MEASWEPELSGSRVAVSFYRQEGKMWFMETTNLGFSTVNISFIPRKGRGGGTRRRWEGRQRGFSAFSQTLVCFYDWSFCAREMNGTFFTLGHRLLTNVAVIMFVFICVGAKPQEA